MLAAAMRIWRVILAISALASDHSDLGILYVNVGEYFEVLAPSPKQIHLEDPHYHDAYPRMLMSTPYVHLIN
jgi:hypothetical protein